MAVSRRQLVQSLALTGAYGAVADGVETAITLEMRFAMCPRLMEPV